MGLKEIVYGGVDWIYVSRVRDRLLKRSERGNERSGSTSSGEFLY
jgi:hypothetical protein